MTATNPENSRIQEGLLQHLRSYLEEHPTEDAGLSRYKLKERGIHYVIEHLPLEEKEKNELKTTLSRRVCLEQALVAEIIPTRYLPAIFANLPEKVKENSGAMEVIRDHLTLAKEVESSGGGKSDSPAPFRMDDDGPYTGIRQPMIKALVDLAKAYTGKTIVMMLNTPEKRRRFDELSQVMIDYLDHHPTNLGYSRN